MHGFFRCFVIVHPTVYLFILFIALLGICLNLEDYQNPYSGLKCVTFNPGNLNIFAAVFHAGLNLSY